MGIEKLPLQPTPLERVKGKLREYQIIAGYYRLLLKDILVFMGTGNDEILTPDYNDWKENLNQAEDLTDWLECLKDFSHTDMPRRSIDLLPYLLLKIEQQLYSNATFSEWRDFFNYLERMKNMPVPVSHMAAETEEKAFGIMLGRIERIQYKNFAQSFARDRKNIIEKVFRIKLAQADTIESKISLRPLALSDETKKKLIAGCTHTSKNLEECTAVVRGLHDWLDDSELEVVWRNLFAGCKNSVEMIGAVKDLQRCGEPVLKSAKNVLRNKYSDLYTVYIAYRSPTIEDAWKNLLSNCPDAKERAALLNALKGESYSTGKKVFEEIDPAGFKKIFKSSGTTTPLDQRRAPPEELDNMWETNDTNDGVPAKNYKPGWFRQQD